jgi:phage baseplate assembly protein W
MATVVYSDFDGEMTKQTDGDLTKDVEFESIRNSLMNIINTMQGSRRMLPEFATDLHRLLFEPIDDITAQMIGERIIEGVRYWDDRVEIMGLDIEPRYDFAEYRCRLNVKIKTSIEVRSIDFILK